MRLSEWPESPTRLAQLIRDADVRFRFGGTRPSQRAQRDSNSSASGSMIVTANQLTAPDAETLFELSFRYRSRCRWQMDRSADNVIIDVNYTQLELIDRHSVWFRVEPAKDGFWDSPLTLHEMDHVQLSSDPRLGGRFKQLLEESSRLERPAPPSRVTSQWLRQQIDTHVRAQFDKIVDLVRIRYQELDRQTNHGRLPVRPDSDLERMLKQAAG
ncbi:MAG: hypothetical protein AAGA03_03565 [Planctomycetota bacterium]